MDLFSFFDSRRQRGEPLVLATVYDTEGSTYSKPGAMMLIDADGVYRGMLSGGCLEGDLAVRSQIVIETARPTCVDYELGGDNDELWGLGTGCEGRIRILLQPLLPTNDYEPLPSIFAIHEGNQPVMATTVVDSLWGDAGQVEMAPYDGAYLPPRLERTRHAEGDTLLLHWLVYPSPRLLVMGAGADAAPVVRFAHELGWRCTIVDHRPAAIAADEFAEVDRAVCCAADDVATQVDFQNFDFAIVMSHHLASDRAYLRALAASDIAYIGLLGPQSRSERLITELGDEARGLEDRLHGPAGLDLGGRGPAAIALSIIAGMQQSLERD